MDVMDVVPITRKSAKSKGKRLQNLIRDLIKEAFSLSDDDIRTAVGQENGADIKLSAKAKAKFPFALECKSRAEFKTLYQYLDQAKGHDPKLVPLVVMKGDRREPIVMLSFEHFLTLVGG